LITTSYGRTIRDDEVIVGSSIQKGLGSTIELFGEVFTVAGRLESTGVSIDRSVFMTLDQAYVISSDHAGPADEVQLRPGEISAVLVKVDRSVGVDRTLYWITVRNPGVLVFPMSGVGREVVDQLSTTAQGLYLTVTMVIIVSLPLIVLISSMTVSERRREIGLMRAMGARREYIFSMFFTEGVFLALLGGAIGVIGSSTGLLIFEGSLSSALQTNIIWPSTSSIIVQICIAVLTSMAIAGLAALWPAFKASRMDPFEAIRSGQN
jgi:putative ABC transport system permease protein